MSDTPRIRRRIPAAWVLVAIGPVMFAIAWFRYAADTSRSWEPSALVGAVAVVAGLVVAATRRPFR